MPTLQDVLFGLGLPALTGMVLFLLGQRKSAAGGHESSVLVSEAHGATVFILGFGFLIGYPTVVQRLPRLPPIEADEWLYLAVLAMIAISIVHQFLWGNRWFWYGSTMTIIGLTIGVTVWLVAKNGWSTLETVGTISVAWLVAGVVNLAVGAACQNETGLPTAIALVAITGMGAAVLAMSGCQTYGQLAATMPAALAPAALLLIPRRTKLISLDCTPMLVLLFGITLLCGHLYVDPGLTLINTLLLFLAPLGLCVGWVPAVRRRKSWQRGTIQFIAAVTPAGIALGLALRQFLIDLAQRRADGY